MQIEDDHIHHQINKWIEIVKGDDDNDDEFLILSLSGDIPCLTMHAEKPIHIIWRNYLTQSQEKLLFWNNHHWIN